MYVFVYLSVIYLTTLLLFGITEHRIGGWIAMEKFVEKFKEIFHFFPTKSEKTTQRVELADISKENLEIEKISKHKKIKNWRIHKHVKKQIEMI